MFKIITIFISILFYNYSFSQIEKNMDLNKVDQNLINKVNEILKTYDKASSFLTIRIYPDNLFNDSIKSNLLFHEDFEGLISVISLNLNEAVRPIYKSDVINWGIDQNLIFEQAKENTKGEINKILFETIDVNEYMKYYVSFDESNYFVNSILLFPELISKYDLNKQGLIIGVPVRHICTIMPVSLTKSIYDDLKNYYSFLIQIYQNEVNPTTLNMFLLKNGEYYPITPLYDEQNNFVKFLAPEILNR